MAILAALEGTGSVMYSNLFVKLPAPSSKTNLSEQIFVITGGNGGLGYESCLHLSKLGVGKLIIAVRNKAKGEAARLKILASTKQPESSIEVWTIDMDSYDSIKAFAARVSSDLPRVDGILANAGIMTTNLAWSEGSESSLNVNVISTFLLFFLLLPKMRESGKKTGNPCRFTIPNSALHYMAPLGELQPGKGSILGRLNDEKTANMGVDILSPSSWCFTSSVRSQREHPRPAKQGTSLSTHPTPASASRTWPGRMQTVLASRCLREFWLAPQRKAAELFSTACWVEQRLMVTI
uniref:Ketoreductase (KR) domain-containing protein n=1 Tax=Bionectria ochroleuca TaxID=29856 RepID=A0A8H7KCU7_BIOOC